MKKENEKKTTLKKLRERIIFELINPEIIGTSSEKNITKILDMIQEEYCNERNMVINFSMGITSRMNHDDIVRKFDETYRVSNK
jgi:hypothetical protein